MDKWQPIETALVGETLLFCNEKEQYVTVGYGEWMDLGHVNLPRWIACDPEGFGRFKPSHWRPLPLPKVGDTNETC